MENKQRLALAIIDFLQASVNDATIPEDSREGMEVAMQCIAEAFGIDASDEATRARLSVKPATLQSVFDVFLATQKKLNNKQETSSSSGNQTPEPKRPEELSAARRAEAEAFKNQGNEKLKIKSFAEAIDLYTKAIEIDSRSAVYYSNRAAAYSSIGDHKRAMDDSLAAIEIDPKYVKGYLRLGHAHYSLGKHKEAIEAYDVAISLEPDNKSHRLSRAAAAAKLAEPKTGLAQGQRPSPAASSSSSGRPDAGGAGGMPDLSSFLSNPAMMQAAAQMMQSGALNDILSNPEMMKMAQNMMGGGGTPDIASMMNNPEIANMARNLNPDVLRSMANGAGGASASDTKIEEM